MAIGRERRRGGRGRGEVHGSIGALLEGNDDLRKKRKRKREERE